MRGCFADCSFPQVVEYGSTYPGYYGGQITVEGYTIPICFYWDDFGNVIMLLDGQVRFCVVQVVCACVFVCICV